MSVKDLFEKWYETPCSHCPHKKLCDSLPEDVSCKTVWELAALEEEEGE